MIIPFPIAFCVLHWNSQSGTGSVNGTSGQMIDRLGERDVPGLKSRAVAGDPFRGRECVLFDPERVTENNQGLKPLV